MFAVVKWIIGHWLYVVITAASATVLIHLQLDKNREIARRQAESQYQACSIDLSQTHDENFALNRRIEANNKRWTDAIEREAKRTARANTEAERVKAENDRISRDLATARATIQGITNPTFKNWAAMPVPADALNIMQDGSGP